LTTKTHAIADARGLPIRFLLTPGQAHNLLGADTLPIDSGEGDVLLGDKAYDADWLRQRIQVQGAAPNIPDKSSRRERHCFSKALYKERNRVERFFNKIKHFRRIVTRFETHAQNDLAMIKLASTRMWMRHNESVASEHLSV